MSSRSNTLFSGGVENIDQLQGRITEWSNTLCEVDDIQVFFGDILAALLQLSGALDQYEEIKQRSRKHQRRNYRAELEEAFNSLQTINGTIFKSHSNPLFKGEEAEVKKQRLKLEQVSVFLLSKQMSLLEIDMKPLLDPKTDPETRREAKEKCPFAAHNEAAPKRSEIRQEFVNSVAHIYLAHTRRLELKRNKHEKAQRITSPFYALLNICFEAEGERVEKDSLKRLVSKAEGAKI